MGIITYILNIGERNYIIIPKMFPKGVYMTNNFNEIQELLQQKADFQARLNLIAYEGTPEIKDKNGNKIYM